jgi:hypothetical protein
VAARPAGQRDHARPQQRRLDGGGPALPGLDTLSEQQKLSTALLVSGFVRNEAALSADVVGTDNQAAQQFGAALAQLTDPVRFPALHRALASGALEDGDGLEAEFDFGLQCILDGVAMLIDTRRPPRSSPHRR